MMELKKTLNMPKGSFEMRGKLPTREPIYIEKCEKMDLYSKMLEATKDGKEFYLHDGPPYANGDLHAGHGMNMVLKDMIIRSKTLEGFHCEFIPGWDTHGLPIENEVTKSGVDRTKMSIAEFRSICMDYAKSQVAHQMKQAKRMGLLGHFEAPYITFQPEYEANEIHVFAKCMEKGLIYRGLKPVHWSPISETACAQADIEYADLPAKTIYVKFPIKKPKYDLAACDCFVIWTTTPWTIPSNLAICLNPDMEYGLYQTDQGRLIFLTCLVEKLTKELGLTNVKLQRVYKGRQLEGVVCQHPFYDRDSIVITGKHVTADDGTGCVHTAPGLGDDDYKVGLKFGLKPFCPVDSKGRLTEECGERLAGMFYEKANDVVIQMLQETGYLLKEVDIHHSYPMDARNHKPLIFRTAPQWFCSLDPIRDDLIKAVESVNFTPEWGKVRLLNMIKGRTDWCISRQRSWGVPIPILYCEDGTPVTDSVVFDWIEKKVAENGSNIWYEKPAEYFIPEGYTNEHSPNGQYTKEKDIMDVWFDSGSSWLGADIKRGMPFPADLYLEGNDQYRGWYNASLILSGAVEGVSPFKAIVTNGFIVDQNGQKFSKSKKNGIYPEAICNDMGADVFRLWVASIDYTTAEISLSKDLLKNVSDEYRKIRNTFKFMLANLCDSDEKMFDPLKDKYKLSLVDEMVLNKLKEVVQKVRKSYEKYDFLTANTTMLNFMVNDLSSFYLDISKDPLYCDEPNSLRRKGVQYTIYQIAKQLAIMYSPILFFTGDEAYQALPGPKKENVALESMPDFSGWDNALNNKYLVLNKIRDQANKALEAARNQGLVKGSNEAELRLDIKSGNYKELLDDLDKVELTRLLSFSKVSYVEGTGTEVVPVKGEKCLRCWNFYNKLNDFMGQPVCPRCEAALKSFVEAHPESLNETADEQKQ